MVGQARGQELTPPLGLPLMTTARSTSRPRRRHTLRMVQAQVISEGEIKLNSLSSLLLPKLSCQRYL